MNSPLRSPAQPERSAPASAAPPSPRVFYPGSWRAANSPASWVWDHLPRIHAALHERGAVLLRGFELNDIEPFVRVSTLVGGPLGQDYEGPSPRHTLAREVYTASEVPAGLVIPEHSEMSYLASMPRHLFFWCRKPADAGGETTIVDGRRVLARLDEQVVESLRRGPVRIRRRHAALGFSLDPFELKPWSATFGTVDRDEALTRARHAGFEAHFDERGALTLESEQPVVRVHPETSEEAWLNHLLVFHASAPAAVLAGAVRRRGHVAKLAAARLTSEYRRWSTRLGREVATDVSFANGEPIPDDVVAHVRDAVDAEAIPVAWQRGDLMIVDNHLALHGRRPYRGSRSVAVAWSKARAA